MELMDLKGREKGMERTDTKETSLKDRYFRKSEDLSASDEVTHHKRSLKRNTHVVVKRKVTEERMHYRVLAVSNRYYNKWYQPRLSEDPPVFLRNKIPDVKLSLQLLKKFEKDGEEGYVPVRDFEKYADTEVYTTLKAKEIYKLLGNFGPV